MKALLVITALAMGANNCPWYDQVCEIKEGIKPTWIGR